MWSVSHEEKEAELQPASRWAMGQTKMSNTFCFPKMNVGNPARQLDRWDVKSGFSQIHLENFQRESVSECDRAN